MKRFVLAVDPGGLTGWAWHATEFDSIPASGQDEPMAFLRRVENALIPNGRDTLVVCEKFSISEGTVRKSREGALLTIRTIGALEWLCHKHGAEFDLTQTPADAKALVTNDRLRALGWWKVGEDHSRDALRHLALRLVKECRITLPVCV